MKKIVIILISFILLLSACNGQIDDIEKPEFSIDPGISQPIPTVTSESSDGLVTIQYIPVRTTHREVNDEYKKRWLDYIKENYDIELKIPIEIVDYESYDGEAQSNLLKNNLAYGLIAFAPAADSKLYELADSGEIMPLTKVIGGNAVWNSLPEDMRIMYEYNGDIWAIPSGYSMSYYVRTIDKEHLDKFNMDAPDTFDELRELFRRLTKDDPDGDGLDNTTGTFVNPWYVIDIFNNMNCFLQHVDNQIQVTSIAFDKNAGKFRDCMFNDDIKQPINYIKGMLDEGIVELNRPIGITAMTYSFFTENGTYGKEMIWGYDGENNNPIIINHNESFIVASAGMENAEESINKFVDTFYGNYEAYLCTQFGLPDEAFRNNGKIEVYHNDFLAYNMPLLIGYSPMLEQSIEYTGASGDWSKRIGYEEASELMSREDAFIIPVKIAFAIKEKTEYMTGSHSGGRRIYGDEILGLFEYYYEQIMNGFMTVDKGIAEYRKRANELNIEEYLAELNSKYID